MIAAAFKRVGIDAHFNEQMPDAGFSEKVRAWEKLPPERNKKVAKALLKANAQQVQQFVQALESTVTRQIQLVRILPLHGTAIEWKTVGEAIEFIRAYDVTNCSKPVVRYEIEIRYNNGNRLNVQFNDKESAVQFLRSYQTPALRLS